MKVSRTELNAASRRVAATLVEAGTPLQVLPVVGLQEIGRMFRTVKTTPYQWRSQGKLPKEDDTISGNPVWKVPTIYKWADDTDREIVWDPWGIRAHQEPEQSGAPS
jgi:hypothetical protein